MPETPSGMQQLQSEAIAAIAKSLAEHLPDISRWLLAMAGNPGDIQTYLGRLGSLPAGREHRFWLANVDDDATVRFEGLFRKATNSESVDVKYHSRITGSNVVILTLINTWSNKYRADFVMDVAGVGRVINFRDSGTDVPPIGLQRNYIWTFNTK